MIHSLNSQSLRRILHIHRNMRSCNCLEIRPCKDKLEWLGCLACRIEDYLEMEKHTMWKMLDLCWIYDEEKVWKLQEMIQLLSCLQREILVIRYSKMGEWDFLYLLNSVCRDNFSRAIDTYLLCLFYASTIIALF